MVAFIIYRKERKKINFRYFKILEISFIIFLFYFAIIAFNSETQSQYGKITNIRSLYPLFLFFSTIAILSTKEYFNKANKYFIYFAIVGSFLAIVQSITGIEPILDKEIFYNIGHWEGQQHMITEDLARVMLPTIYLIYVVFIALFAYIQIHHKNKYYSLMALFLIPIFVGYARSQWVAIILCMLFVLIFVSNLEHYKFKRMLKNVILLLAIFFISLSILNYIAGGYIITELYERAINTYHDIYLESGTFGSRLQTMGLSLSIWASSPYIGHGIYYSQFEVMPQLSDIGFTYVLVTIGIIGLVLFLSYLFMNMVYGYAIISFANKNKNKVLFNAGLVTLLTSILFFITQHYTQHNYTISLLAISSAYSVVVYKLEQIK